MSAPESDRLAALRRLVPAPLVVAGMVTVAILAGLGSHALKGMAQVDRDSWPKTQSYKVRVPRVVAKAIGREVMADLYWVRTTVYFGENWAGEGDLRYLPVLVDDIMDFDPYFKRPYRFASYAVTERSRRPSNSDYLLSIHYLERAMKVFSDDYEPFWLAGVRYRYDLRTNDENQKRRWRERGAELIELAMERPNAPPDLATKAAGLRTELGQIERAKENLTRMMMIVRDPEQRAELQRRLEALSNEGAAAAVARAAVEFEELWQANHPNITATMFVLLGPRPEPIVDVHTLATERNLFGTDEVPDQDPDAVPDQVPDSVPDTEPTSPTGPTGTTGTTGTNDVPEPEGSTTGPGQP